MSINANGILFSANSSMMTTTTSIGNTLKFSSGGAVAKANQTFFAAIGNTGYVTLTGNSYNKIIMTYVVSNVGSGYNPALSRFTAPVDGTYFFTGTSYLNNTSANNYVLYHPMFWVNGGASRQPNTTYYHYRIRHYGFSVASYDDGMIYQLIYLLAGDYVEYIHYFQKPDSNDSKYYDYYTRFSGILVG